MRDYLPIAVTLLLVIFCSFICFSIVDHFETQAKRMTLCEQKIEALSKNLQKPTILMLELDPEKGFVLKEKKGGP